MNAVIRKEIRLLLPAWVVAVGTSVLAAWDWGGWGGATGFVRAAAVLALVLSAFGKEISLGTFGLLLSQPAERARLWRTKITLLAVALVSVWVVSALCSWRFDSTEDWLEKIVEAALVLVLAFSGGLWSSLLLRDMVSALFCTCMAPVLVWGLTFGIASHWMNTDGPAFIIGSGAILLVYAVAGYFWARRLLLRAEDVPWTGGQISLRPGRGLPLLGVALECARGQSRWMALVKKEIQLQEITMALVPLFALLSIAGLAVHHFTPEWHGGALLAEAIPLVWLAAVPWVIGAVAVAEERRLNTLEGFFCLPVSRRASFTLKLAVAVGLAIVVGGWLPGLAMRLNSSPGSPSFTMGVVAVLAALITGFGFYASTMSRGLLQALPTSFGVLFAMALLGTMAAREINTERTAFYPFAGSSLFPTLAWSTGVFTMTWLAYRNYSRLQIDWRVWMGDLIRAAIVVTCMTFLGVGIFERDWQLLMTMEPPHGAARISGPGRAMMGANYWSVDVVLPDGRLWVGQRKWPHPQLTGGFVEGSDWAKLAVADRAAAVAIKSDGTLWQVGGTLWRAGERIELGQIGSDSDWKEVSGVGSTFLAVKQNGTLWGWGTDKAGLLSEKSEHAEHPLEVPSPISIQEGSNWISVFPYGNEEALGVKSDGSIWKWGNHEAGETVESPMHTPIPFRQTSSDWKGVSRVGQETLALRADGGLTIFGAWQSHLDSLAGKADWISVSGDWHAAALEANGALWSMEWTGVKHPSRYTDWIAATGFGGQTWALARDGTLTCWNEFGIDTGDGNGGPAPFLKRFYLGPNRRPVFSTNIFGQ